MRFIGGYKSPGICYGGENKIVPIGYNDVDWGGDVNSRNFTSGYVFMMEAERSVGLRGSRLLWQH